MKSNGKDLREADCEVSDIITTPIYVQLSVIGVMVSKKFQFLPPSTGMVSSSHWLNVDYLSPMLKVDSS